MDTAMATDSTATSPSSSTSTSPSSSQSDVCLTSLPDEVISMCYAGLSANDLIALEHVSSHLHKLIAGDALCWRECVAARWNKQCCNPGVMDRAAEHAGSWKALYAEKAAAHKTYAPWLMVCASEVQAMVDTITKRSREDDDDDDDDQVGDGDVAMSDGHKYAVGGQQIQQQHTLHSQRNMNVDVEPGSPPRQQTQTLAMPSPVSVMMNPTRSAVDAVAASGAKPLNAGSSVMVLFDASSSVTDEDFKTMKRFTRSLVERLCRRSTKGVENYVGLIQFNQHPRVELALTLATKPKVTATVDSMAQIMGSTDIAAPIRRAREALADAPPTARKHRTIVLITDGQTHADELRESEREATRAKDDFGASVYTIGVGRDIDEKGLTRIAKASADGMYFTLRRFVHKR